jgi:hypothetical protein
MSDIPDEMIPDGMQHIGGAQPIDLVVQDCIFPTAEGAQVTDPPKPCMVCDEHKDVLCIGYERETHANRYICLFCRIKCANIEDNTPK